MKAGKMTPELLRAHASAADSMAWQSQARMLLVWAADTLSAAESVMLESARPEAEELKAARAALRDACSYFTVDGKATVRQRLTEYGRHTKAVNAAYSHEPQNGETK